MKIDWQIRYPFIEAFCHACQTKFIIEYVTLTTRIKHCGGCRTPLPEKTYELWCDVRDGKLTGKRYAAEGQEPPTAGDGKLPSATPPSRLDFNAKYF
jgi:hypothetical protein